MIRFRYDSRRGTRSRYRRGLGDGFPGFRQLKTLIGNLLVLRPNVRFQLGDPFLSRLGGGTRLLGDGARLLAQALARLHELELTGCQLHLHLLECGALLVHFALRLAQSHAIAIGNTARLRHILGVSATLASHRLPQLIGF